jgi:hypothetical protein
MFRNPRHYEDFSQTVAILSYTALPKGEAYPPPGHWVAEDAEVHGIWKPYMETVKLPDARRKRSPTHLLEHGRLQGVIPAEVNCIIQDKTTGEPVFAMFRNFCPTKEILDWARELVYEAVTTRKDIRVSSEFSTFPLLLSNTLISCRWKILEQLLK